MALVGSAEVVVRAITNRVRSDIERAFADARPAVQKAGRQAGEDFGKSFSDGLGDKISQGADRGFERSIDNATASGREAGSQFGEEFEKSVSGVNIGSAGRKLGTDFGDSARDGLRSSIGGLETEARGGGNRAGNGGGSAFGRAFNSALNSEFAKVAPAASAAFTAVFAGANIAGTGIAVLVSSLSAVVSGLYAIVSAAGVAAGSIAVLPGALAAAGQALGTIKLAFGSVGEALKAGTKAQVANTAATASGTGASQASAAASYAAADARKALQRALQDAAYAQAQAADRVRDAEREVAAAQMDVLNVQKQLNAARKEAAETLQQLAFSAEDAALGEERAALTLEDAYAKLQAVKNLPPDDRTRREAELSYKEAELAYREAKDRNSDLAKEQKRATKAGIEGSSEVVDAQNAISDAKEALAQKEKALADAREAAAKQELDSSRAIADARQALARAQQRVNTAAASPAIPAAAKSADAYAEALSKLSPAAQDFVRYLISIKDRFKELRAAAGERLFPQLQVAIQNLIDGALPDLENALRVTGGTLGELAVGFSKGVTEGDNFKRVLDGSNEILSVFTRRNSDGSNSAQQLSRVMLRLLVAVQPITQRFAEFIRHLIDLADKATDTKREMNGLTDFFNRAGDRAALLGDIIKNLFGVLTDLGGIADKTGEGLLVSFDKSLIRLRKFLQEPENQADLRKYFADVADNVRSISDALVLVAGGFLSLGDNPGIKKFFDSIEPAVKNFTQLGDNLTDSGDGLAEFINNLSVLLLAFGDSQGIRVFFNTLNAGFDLLFGAVRVVTGAIDGLFGEGTTRKIFVIVGAVLTMIRTISFMRSIVVKAFQILLGGPIKFIKKLREGEGAIGKFAKRMGLIRGAGEAAESGLEGAARASDQAKAAFERQMGTDREKIATLKLVEEQADKTAFALGRVKTAGSPAAGAAAKAAPIAQSAAKPVAAAVPPTAATSTVKPNYVVPPAAAANTSKLARAASLAAKPVSGLAKGFGFLSTALLGVSGPVAAVIGAVVLLVIGLKKLYGVSPEFRAFVDGIVDKLKQLGGWFKDILMKYVVPFLDGMFKKINDVLPKIGKFFGDVFSEIGPAVGAAFNFIVNAVQVAIAVISAIMPTLKVIFEVVFKSIIFYITKVIVPGFKLVWGVVKTMFAIVVPIVKALGVIIGAVFKAVKFYITTFVIPYFKLLWGAIQGAWNIIKPILSVFGTVIGALFRGIKNVIAGIFIPVWNRMKAAFIVARAVVGRVANRIGDFIRTMGRVIKTVVENVIRPVLNGFKNIMGTVRDVIGKVIKFGIDRFNDFKRGISIFRAAISPIIAKVRDIFESVRDKVRDVISAVKERFNDFVDKIGEVRDKIRGPVEKIKDIFSGITTAAKNAFANIVDKIKAPIRSMLEFINNKMIGNINKVTTKFGMKIGTISLSGFAEGGYTGPGSKYKVAGLVHADEYVIPKTARRAIERDNPGALDFMRKTGTLPANMIPMGDWGPLGAIAGSIGNAANKTWNSFENLAKSGVGKVLEQLVLGAKGLLDNAGIERGPYLNDFMYGIMDKLAAAAKNWGESKQKEAERKAAPPSGATIPIKNITNPTGHMSWKGGEFTRLFVAHMQAAERYAKTSISVIQGGFRPSTSYSGSTHNGDAIDLQVNYALIRALRAAGIAAGDRTGLGNWGPHVHAVPGPGAGYGSPSARAQFADYVRRGGAKQSYRSPWGLARGGLVHATPGGILANIGEAGRNERVEPLALDGFSSRDRAIIDLIKTQIAAGGGQGGDTYKIYPSEGMDEQALAMKVSRRVAWRKSVGT